MYKLGGSDEYVTCPYNPAHEVQRIRFQSHILKCRKQYPNIQLSTCFYNYKHLVKAEDMAKHLAECGDKQRLEGSRYGSSIAPSSAIEKDEEKEESVISFGSDFIDSLPSNDDSSSVISRTSSSIRGRGNALLKVGPMGNLSRYANNERKTKWENAEINFLETYDQVVSNYVPQPVSPDLSPEKIEVKRFKPSPAGLKKKLMEDELKSTPVIVNKKFEDDELTPLPLPKTTSKAFASTMTSLQSEIESEKIKNESLNCDKKQKVKNIKKKDYPKYYDDDYDSGEKQEVNYDAFIFNPVEVDNRNRKCDSSYRRNIFLNHNYDKMVGRGMNFDEPGTELRSGRVADNLDEEVAKKSNEKKLFLKSGYSLFPDHENDGSMKDDSARYEDADEEDEDREEQEDEDIKDSPLLMALNRFVKKKEAKLKENKFLTSPRSKNSSDETTDSDCQSISSVIQRKPPSPTKKKGIFSKESDDELSIFRNQGPRNKFPAVGRGFRTYKNENVKPLGRGFNIL